MRIGVVGVFGLVLATAGFGQDDWPTHSGDPGSEARVFIHTRWRLIGLDGAPKLIAFGLPS